MYSNHQCGQRSIELKVSCMVHHGEQGREGVHEEMRGTKQCKLILQTKIPTYKIFELQLNRMCLNTTQHPKILLSFYQKVGKSGKHIIFWNDRVRFLTLIPEVLKQGREIKEANRHP